MRLIILSLDYEIFGNGSGDVLQHVVRPAAAMAAACERHGVPLTIFFEAEEFLAFQRHSKPLSTALGYNPAEAIQSQLISLVRAGHDVQLHLHPEWHGAKFENGRWLLQPEKRAVDQLFETQAEVTAYIAERKGLVEEILAKAGSPRKVRVYRAGAFTAQPGCKLLAALAQNEMWIDSSVVKGLYGPAHRGLDYRQAPSAKGPWRVKEDVAVEDTAGQIWEFPIYSVMGRRFHQVTFGRLRAKFSKNVPKERQRQMMDQLGIDRRNPFKLLKFLWQPVPLKLDFHNLKAAKFLRWVKAAPSPEPGLPDVVVSIGHTKEHMDDHNFELLLEALADDSTLQVTTFDALATMLKHEGKTKDRDSLARQRR
jgi:hypothetical protein